MQQTWREKPQLTPSSFPKLILCVYLNRKSDKSACLITSVVGHERWGSLSEAESVATSSLLFLGFALNQLTSLWLKPTLGFDCTDVWRSPAMVQCGKQTTISDMSWHSALLVLGAWNFSRLWLLVIEKLPSGRSRKFVVLTLVEAPTSTMEWCCYFTSVWAPPGPHCPLYYC